MENERKTALVTGAGGYVGGAIARTLALGEEHYRVAVCDINGETAQKTVDDILASGGEAFAYVMDVADPRSVDAGFAELISRYGRLDLAVHAAGGSAKIAGPNARYCDLVEQEDYVFDAVVKINLYGAAYISRAAGRELIKEDHGGRIIHISSAIGLSGFNGKAEYAAAKGGVIALAKALAKEMGKYRVTVNTVAPGAIGNTWVPDEALYGAGFIASRRGSAQDIANAVEFLASDKAGYITGQTLVVDGGRTLALKGTD